MCSRKRLTFIKDFINNESVCHFMVVQLFKLSTKDVTHLAKFNFSKQVSYFNLSKVPVVLLTTKIYARIQKRTKPLNFSSFFKLTAIFDGFFNVIAWWTCTCQLKL